MPDGCSPRWKKGGTMLPRKSVIETIPAIKTHHAAISLDFNISQNHIKGPGYWKVNCSLLDDENYRREPRLRLKCLSGRSSADVTCRITDVFGIGLSQYNLRAHAVQFSKLKAKRKAKEKKKIRRTYCKMNLTMQRKRSNVTLPIIASILKRRKENCNIFMKKNFKVSSFAQSGEKEPRQKTCAKIED